VRVAVATRCVMWWAANDAGGEYGLYAASRGEASSTCHCTAPAGYGPAGLGDLRTMERKVTLNPSDLCSPTWPLAASGSFAKRCVSTFIGTRFCIAGDDSGGIIVTSDPTGGSSAWHVYVIPGMGGSFSCPAPSFCVVATGSNTTGLSGVSINPLLAPSACSVSQAGSSGYVSCPAVSACFFLDFKGTVSVDTAS
jgi:hypothetical protein